MPRELEQYFDNEETWSEYAKFFEEFWVGSESQIELLELCNHRKDIAMVIYGNCWQSSIKWMQYNIPALDDLRPIDCLEDENLLKRLKVCLRRMK